MPSYPPTLQELKDRLAIFPFLPTLTDAQYSTYLELAKAKVEMRIPQLRYGSITADVEHQAWAVCLNLAAAYVRMDVERNPDSSIPIALSQSIRQYELDLEDLASYVWQRTGVISASVSEIAGSSEGGSE